MTLPGFLSAQDNGLFLSIKVRVTAPPVDSAADQAVLEFLAATRHRFANPSHSGRSAQ